MVRRATAFELLEFFLPFLGHELREFFGQRGEEIFQGRLALARIPIWKTDIEMSDEHLAVRPCDLVEPGRAILLADFEIALRTVLFSRLDFRRKKFGVQLQALLIPTCRARGIPGIFHRVIDELRRVLARDFRRKRDAHVGEKRSLALRRRLTRGCGSGGLVHWCHGLGGRCPGRRRIEQFH